MILNELKKKIDELVEQGNGDMEIIISSDAEGNSFNELDEIITSLCYGDEMVHSDDVEEGYYDKADLVEKLVIWTC